MRENVMSVGIDIGTSTTQLIFSRITVENLSSSYTAPRISIVDKEVIYRSNIYFTPLKSETEIDVAGIRSIIEKEYQSAGMKPSDLKTGAVIITGDTARKTNADNVLQSLSSMAGDFVVATAGPDLESVLSARGAGTDKVSGETHQVIANLDIGGGTTNIAVYDNGKLAGTTCLDIGGRLIRVEDGRITRIFPKIKALAEARGISVEEGERADITKLRMLAEIMADQLAQSLGLKEKEKAHLKLYTNDGKPLSLKKPLRAVTLSGGVADCVDMDISKEPFPFGDIGALLGNAIRTNGEIQKLGRYDAVETIRATVVGAGSHSMSLSGSTVHYEDGLLPKKNIPIVKIPEELETSRSAVIENVKQQLALFHKDEQLALALCGDGYNSFEEIQALAGTLLEAGKDMYEKHVFVVLVENDIGKALGNAMLHQSGGRLKIICLDNVYATDGDYIDLGIPMANGRVVPVVIKTIVFNT